MPTIDATVGGTTANSYAIRSAFLAWADERLDGVIVSAASGTEQDRALIMAARRLNNEHYEGEKASQNQALAFPRVGILDADFRELPSDTIPVDIVYAQFELALALLDGAYENKDTGLEQLDSMSVDAVNLTPSGREGGELPAQVYRYLADYLSAQTAQIMRS